MALNPKPHITGQDACTLTASRLSELYMHRAARRDEAHPEKHGEWTADDLALRDNHTER